VNSKLKLKAADLKKIEFTVNTGQVMLEKSINTDP